MQTIRRNIQHTYIQQWSSVLVMIQFVHYNMREMKTIIVCYLLCNFDVFKYGLCTEIWTKSLVDFYMIHLSLFMYRLVAHGIKGSMFDNILNSRNDILVSEHRHHMGGAFTHCLKFILLDLIQWKCPDYYQSFISWRNLFPRIIGKTLFSSTTKNIHATITICLVTNPDVSWHLDTIIHSCVLHI